MFCFVDTLHATTGVLLGDWLSTQCAISGGFKDSVAANFDPAQFIANHLLCG